MANLTTLFAWLNATIDAMPEQQGKVTLHINGGAVAAQMETTRKWVDTQGRLVQVLHTTTTHLQIERGGSGTAK